MMKSIYKKLFLFLVVLMFTATGCQNVDSSSVNNSLSTSISLSTIISESTSKEDSTSSPSSVVSVLQGVSIEGVKTEFLIGDDFSSEGIIVELIYSDKEESLNEDQYTIDSSAFNNLVAGTYSISVTIKDRDLKKDYDVTVSHRVVDYKESIKILAVGNSFSEDSMQYIHNLLKAKGVKEVILGNLVIGGCTLQTHASNAITGARAYGYQKNTTGSWSSTSGVSLKTGLEDEEWDIISIQQASPLSGVASSYNNDLTTLINFFHTNKLNPEARIVWNMTWAYQSNSNHGAFPTYNKNQMTMYNAIVDATLTKIETNDGIALTIPTGTAIQNVRTSYIGDTLTRDGYHLSLDLGRYIAGMMWVKALTGWSIDDITYVPNFVTINSNALKVVKEGVNNAMAKPYEVTPSEFGSAGMPNLSNHKLLDWKPVGSAYWFSTKTADYNKLLSLEGNSINYVCSAVRFTKEQIPVGSYLILKSGWQYRPEGWVADTVQTTRQGNVVTSVVKVTEEWWGNYTLRAFNVSKVSTPSLKRDFVLATDAFKIYIPNATPITPNIQPDDSGLIDNIGNYERLNWMPINGFYDSTVSIDIDTLSKTLLPRFITTKLFTPAELPVGTIMIVDSGWQYRLERWIDESPQIAPRLNDSTTKIVIDETFWGDYNYVAFNISQADNATSINQTPIEANGAFRIYIPK